MGNSRERRAAGRSDTVMGFEIAVAAGNRPERPPKGAPGAGRRSDAAGQ